MKTTKARKRTLAVSFIVLFSIGTLLGSILILPEGNSYKDKSNHTVLSNGSENSADNTLSAEEPSSDADDSKPSESVGADPEQTNSEGQNSAGEGADSSQNSEGKNWAG